MKPDYIEEGMKYCSRCEVTQPIRNFYSNKSRKDGVVTWCKPCWDNSEKQKAAKARYARDR